MRVDPRAEPWLVRPRALPDARLRLFCFPFAGGGASTYRAWPQHLPADIEVAAVQLPGREERLREAPIHNAADLCPQLAVALAPYLDRPFAFFGHSMGALLAFELTRTLRRACQPLPTQLFVSAHCGPRKPHCLPPVAGLNDRELLRLLRRLGGTRNEVLDDSEVMRVLLPLLRADLGLCETYRYAADAALPCPISAFGGTLDDFVRRADLMSWKAETKSAFQTRMFPGGHFFLDDIRPRLLQTIAEDLADPTSVTRASAPLHDGGLST